MEDLVQKKLRKMKILIYGVLFMSINQVIGNLPYLTNSNSNEDCGSNKDIFQGCSEDCASQIFCFGNHLTKLDCNQQTGGEKPYCNPINNLCQSEEVTCNSNNNPSNPNEFQCPDQNGYYPDPLNCTKYYECNNKISLSEYCRGGSKFNPSVGGCDKLVRCVQFSLDGIECRNKKGKYVVHPLNKNLYVKCETYPIVKRCPTDNIFDVKAQGCKYNCKKKGSFPDNDNEEYFYVCEKAGLYWAPKHEKCSEGMKYDVGFAGCISKPPEEISKPPEEKSTTPEEKSTIPVIIPP